MHDTGPGKRESNIIAIWGRDDPKRYQAYVNLNFVFQGTPMDDVASAVFKVERPTRALILGASLGSVLLPLSAFAGVEEVVLVDLDETNSPLLERLRNSIDVRVSVSDALDYLEAGNDLFDLIFVDLFTEVGYAEVMLDKRLYQAMHGRLREKGAILVNAFDIPSYLFPETGKTVTSTLMNLLADELSEVFYLKHRRNSLLLAGKAVHQVYSHQVRPLSPLDEQRLCLARERANEFRPIPASAQSVSSPWVTAPFDDIGRLLFRRMASLLGECVARYDLGQWGSFQDLALRADPQHQVFRDALCSSEFLRHVVLMELAANTFSDPKTSLAQLAAILKSLNGSFAFSRAYRSQAIVDLHAMSVAGSDEMCAELDCLVATMRL